MEFDGQTRHGRISRVIFPAGETILPRQIASAHGAERRYNPTMGKIATAVVWVAVIVLILSAMLWLIQSIADGCRAPRPAELHHET